MRAVCDTNAVVSALLFAEGRLTWQRQVWRDGRVVPIVSSDTVKELLRVLEYPKFGLSSEDRDELLGDYLPFAETATAQSLDPPAASAALNGPLVRCRDASDQMFLDLALAARADALITGDTDLLALAETYPVAIITPAEARRRSSPGARR